MAARALIGLKQTSKDIAFWQEVAEHCLPALPYALRATLQTSLYKGCVLFWSMYLQPGLRGENPYVDWLAMLDATDGMYGGADSVAPVLERAFGSVTGSDDPIQYERMIRSELKARRYSRIGDRTIQEAHIRYDRPTRGAPAPSRVSVAAEGPLGLYKHFIDPGPEPEPDPNVGYDVVPTQIASSASDLPRFNWYGSPPQEN